MDGMISHVNIQKECIPLLTGFCPEPKNTPVQERVTLQFRAEFFNALNHTNLGAPNPIVFLGTSVSPSAGLITTTATTSRQIQLGLKLIY